ncbi:MAG TPA: nicotinate-nucleotide--dimethylbenzimidazole phosphoribosyltransferase, partial [Actinomycetota bacterium]
PIVIDGVIADAALLVAERLAPGCAAGCIAGHRSTEPAATIALAAIGLEPLLDLDLRLGEGTGAVLALPLLESAARLLTDVATIAEITGS